MNTNNKRVARKRAINPASGSITVIIFVVIVLIVVMFIAGHRLQNRIASNNDRIEEIKSQIESEEQRTQEIEDLRTYMQSDEYLERAAKEKMGLIKDGEIIFKENS